MTINNDYIKPRKYGMKCVPFLVRGLHLDGYHDRDIFFGSILRRSILRETQT